MADDSMPSSRNSSPQRTSLIRTKSEFLREKSDKNGHGLSKSAVESDNLKTKIPSIYVPTKSGYLTNATILDLAKRHLRSVPNSPIRTQKQHQQQTNFNNKNEGSLITNAGQPSVLSNISQINMRSRSDLTPRSYQNFARGNSILRSTYHRVYPKFSQQNSLSTTSSISSPSSSSSSHIPTFNFRRNTQQNVLTMSSTNLYPDSISGKRL